MDTFKQGCQPLKSLIRAILTWRKYPKFWENSAKWQKILFSYIFGLHKWDLNLRPLDPQSSLLTVRPHGIFILLTSFCFYYWTSTFNNSDIKFLFSDNTSIMSLTKCCCCYINLSTGVTLIGWISIHLSLVYCFFLATSSQPSNILQMIGHAAFFGSSIALVAGMKKVNRW